MDIKRETANNLFAAMGLDVRSFKDHQVLERLQNLPTSLADGSLHEPASDEMRALCKKITRIIEEGDATTIRVLMHKDAHRYTRTPKPEPPRDPAFDQLLRRLVDCNLCERAGRDDWDKINAEQEPGIRDGGVVYFATGAYREINTPNGLPGVRMNPPADAHERAQLVELYWRIRYESARAKLQAIGAELKKHVHFDVIDHAKLEDAKKIRAEFDLTQKKLEQAIEKTVTSDPNFRTPEQVERDRELAFCRQQQRNEFAQAVDEVTRV